MGKVRKIARRTFLFGSVAIAGGVAFGIYAAKRTPHNPLLDGLKSGEASFNPWVKISKDGITLIAPHADVGQGVRSMQAALIAEEMDLEFGQFDIEPGPPAQAYFNTAVDVDNVPFRGRDEGMIANSYRSITDAGVKIIGLQMTGGSTSAMDSYEKLRQAGAVARETLKLAASSVHNVPADQLRTESGAVYLPDGTAVPYTSLAEAAAQIEPVEEVSLRSPEQWQMLGKPMQRADVVEKSTGTLSYGIDLHMDGMVNATVRMNPHRGGVMNSFDASKAESMPGVSHILEVTDGVAVVADNTWNAFQAASSIDINWGPASYPDDTEGHWEEVIASFTDDRKDWTWRDDGDVDDVISEDDPSFEYRAPYMAHAPLEPISALVRVQDTRVDIWVAHQLPRFAQDLVADITGFDKDDVHVHNQYAGGSFGHRFEMENVRYATEVANQLRGTPVKLTFTREEDFAQDFVRPAGAARARGKVGDGKVQALDISVAAPAVVQNQYRRLGFPLAGPDLAIAAGVWDSPYAFDNHRMTAYRVPELVGATTWRSVGASTGGFYLESAMDELIHAAGADPLEERLRLCDDEIARSVLEAVGNLCDWGSELGESRGRGLALVHSFGVYVAEVVDVTNTPKGIRLDKVYVATDVGKVLDPVNFDNQLKGGIIWGLGHAMNCEITYKDGKVEQSNYHQFQAMRMAQCPEIEVVVLENGPIRGIGEPPVPPAAPALANAIFAATGQRLREMPFNKFVDFA